jgi:hypothetical protein
MKTAGTQHLIERTYREGGTFQWVRETYLNAIEAAATKVEYGVEWQAVDSLAVYRRLIADNGHSMKPDEMVEFFNTFGGGGKPIGGEHENFGVGAIARRAGSKRRPRTQRNTAVGYRSLTTHRGIRSSRLRTI